MSSSDFTPANGAMSPPQNSASGKSSTANKATAACIPCFKRKMKCDRELPCSNCRRRRNQTEACHYPTAPSAASVADLTHRLEKLENYVRATGVDPDMVVRDKDLATHMPVTPKSNESTPTPLPSGPKALDRSSSTWPGRYAWEATIPYRLPSPTGRSEPDEEAVEAPNPFTFFRPTRHIPFLAYEYPSPPIMQTLWKHYVTNVHMIIRLFFDWQKTPLVEKACLAPNTMSPDDHAFVFNMLFLAVSSLSNERCQKLLSKDCDKAMEEFQSLAEYALWNAGVPNNVTLETYQALVMYLMAIRNWGNVPAGTMLSLTAIATRQAERIGLPVDGTELGISPVETEVRRRVWWQTVCLDLTTCLLTGTLAPGLHHNWTTQHPGNYEDCDFSAETTEFPPQRKGITASSDGILLYRIFEISRGKDHDGKILGMTWAFRNKLTKEEKEKRIDDFMSQASTDFLQYCEPNLPHHIMVSVNIRRYMCGFQYMLNSPARGRHLPFNSTEPLLMDQENREGQFQLALRLLEYHAYVMTAPVLKDFIWHTKNGVMWPSLVYALVDVRHRIPGTPDLDRFWTAIAQLFEKDYSPFRNLKSALYLSTAELILDVWTVHVSEEDEKNPPFYITWLRENLPSSGRAKKVKKDYLATAPQPTNGLPPGNGLAGPVAATGEPPSAEWSQLAGEDFTAEAFLADLANTDWSFWDTF